MGKEELFSMGKDEALTPPSLRVVRVTEGLGFGEGSISSQTDPEVLAALDQVIHDSPDIIVPIEVRDDGCSDGREAVEIFDKSRRYKRSLARPKVFGGALVMASAIDIGLGRAEGKCLQDLFEDSALELDKAGLDYGAHTDELAHGPHCGCGAIDKAPEALAAATKYEKEIREAIAMLGIDTEGLDAVYANYYRYLASQQFSKVEYSGRNVIKRVLSAGKVIKKLGGQHRERRIVLNTVYDYTVNQALPRKATRGKGQVFALDTWRLEDIARGVTSDSTQQNMALLSELVYTFGTSAVLTSGDLPVDLVQAA